MRSIPFFLIILILAAGCSGNNIKTPALSENKVKWDTSDATNNFYDNTEQHALQIPEITIEGEIANPGKADLSSLPVHSVFVKETLLDRTGGDKFTGAYRYDGYSLFDILNLTVLKKANAKEFNPIIDLYVEVENGRGEKALFSWGEIYYPNSLHRIIIAGSVSRIVPSKTKDLWPLPTESRIVSATDLVTERNISSPVKITVRSFPKSFTVKKGLSPMYEKDFSVFDGDRKLATLTPEVKDLTIYNTVFYGRGKGIHSTSPFKGILLKDVIGKYYPVSKESLRSGLVCLVAKDGYRCTLTYSELFNRNDQQEFLLIRTAPDEDGGLFRVFAAADFFSDRAVKSLSGIYMIR